MQYWKPSESSIYLPLKDNVLHYLEGPFLSLHPGYLDKKIYLEGKEFLYANGLYGYSTAHCYYACLMKNKKQAEDVIKSSTAAIAREKASFYKPRPDWRWHSVGLMEDIIYKRFNSQHSKEILLSTWPLVILPYIDKGNTFWGCKKVIYGYMGLNIIGKALMRYREWLTL